MGHLGRTRLTLSPKPVLEAFLTCSEDLEGYSWVEEALSLSHPVGRAAMGAGVMSLPLLLVNLQGTEQEA